MKENELRTMLATQVSEYLNNIAIELEEQHDGWFDNFGFPMLFQTSKDYFEQVYFQSYLESYTRKMINCILQYMFDADVGEHITWPEFESIGVYNGYTNNEYERDFGFEFINHDLKVGYRYTKVNLDEIDALLEKGKVEKISIIVWQNDDDPVYCSYADERVEAVLLWDFFRETFFDLDECEVKSMYGLFTQHIMDAVKRANEMISLKTIPGFTPAYRHKSRNETMHNLIKEVESLPFFYVQNSNFHETQEESCRLIDRFALPKYFIDHHMEQVFVGSGPYAKCFLTSEYLYSYFRENPMFDYTPIVSGYIKSIELLLNIICRNYCIAKRVNENVGNFTLGGYINFVERHKDIVRPNVRECHGILVKCLNSYRAESRNHLFHKDTFNDWNRVENIRRNTIFLYMTLLGASDIDQFTSGARIPGTLDETYDSLFYVLDDQRDDYYSITLKGREYSQYMKLRRDEGIVFDQNGLIENTIKFGKFDYDHYDYIEIDRRNIPSEIWTQDVFGRKKHKLWPI